MSETPRLKRIEEWFYKERREIFIGIGGILVGLIGASAALLTSVEPYVISNNKEAVIQGDLTSAYGKFENGSNRINLLEGSDNTKKLQYLFGNSHNNIKIVTIDGATWLWSDLQLAFDDANQRIPISILAFNYGNTNLRSIWNDTMSTYATSIWRDKTFIKDLKQYQSQFDSQGKGLTIGLYNIYPWTRFTIFDDRAVSFIITPNIKGDGVNKYYSDDPYVVRCFEFIYNEYKESADRSGLLFKNSAEFKAFTAHWGIH